MAILPRTKALLLLIMLSMKSASSSWLAAAMGSPLGLPAAEAPDGRAEAVKRRSLLQQQLSPTPLSPPTAPPQQGPPPQPAGQQPQPQPEPIPTLRPSSPPSPPPEVPPQSEQQVAEGLLRHPQDLGCNSSHFMNLIYKGSVCHEANIWPKGPCPIEGACVPACSRCVNWRRGQLPLADPAAWPVGAANPPSSPPPSPVGGGKTPCDSTIWGFGLWRGQEWTPSAIYPQCSSALMSPPAIYQCLKGKRVTLFGDSMIRPLMGRLVAYLRDIPQYIDHLFHQPGGYYMANGTHDVFVEGRFSPSRHASFRATHPEHRVPVTPEDGWDPRVTLEMQLYWAPHFVRYNLDGRTYPSLSEHFGVMDGADIMIAGPMYHNGLEYGDFRDELLSYFRKLAHAHKRISHFFWVATIPVGTSTYEERNYLMRAFVEMLNERALYGDHAVPKYSYYVDAARMARSAPVQRADEHHFQCNKHGIFPGMLSSDMWGVAQNLDCRDVFNLNVMQSILKVACNA